MLLPAPVHRRIWGPVGAGTIPRTDEGSTIEELAVYIKLSKFTLYWLVQSGEVPGQTNGRHWRFSRAVIDGWLSNALPTECEPMPRRGSLH